MLVSRGSRQRLRLGDRVTVRVDAADPVRGRIDFSLARTAIADGSAARAQPEQAKRAARRSRAKS